MAKGNAYYGNFVPRRDTQFDYSQRPAYGYNSAPVAVGNMVVIGSTGGEAPSQHPRFALGGFVVRSIRTRLRGDLAEDLI